MELNTVNITVGQDLYDIALQETGTIESIFDIIQANIDSIPDVNAFVAPVSTVVVPDTENINLQVQRSYSKYPNEIVKINNNELQDATKRPFSIETAIIEDTFIIYEDDFSVIRPFYPIAF